MNPEYASSIPDPTERLLPYVRQVMNVRSVVRGEAKDQAAARFVGRLMMDSEEAYNRLSREFERMGVTLLFSMSDTNGTLARLTGRAVRLCRGRAGLHT